MDTQHTHESTEGQVNSGAGNERERPSEAFRRNSKAPPSYPNFDVHLMHERLPKVVVNIQGRTTSVQTPSPVPKNQLRTQQLQEILEPLHLSLLREDSKPQTMKPSETETEIQLRILQSLIKQRPEVLSLPDLHLKVQDLKLGRSEYSFPSAKEVLERTRRNFVKSQTLAKDAEVLKPERAQRLSKILDSVTRLDASVKLKKKTWMFKPRGGGSAKDKLDAQLKFRKKLRNQYPPSESQSSPMDMDGSEKESSTKQNSESSSSEIVTEAVDPKDKAGENPDKASKMLPPAPPSNAEESAEKKPAMLTKAQLKQVPKKKPSKSRHRVLVLPRKCKIRPGTLFKCRRTKEKFTFTTDHRTITESGLALLTAAYALRSGSIQSEIQEKERHHNINAARPTCKAGPTTLPSSIDPNTSLRELARLSQFGSTGGEQNTGASSSATKGNCYCSNASTAGTTQRKPKPKSVVLSMRKSSLQNPSMVLVNRYAQSLQDSNPETVEFPSPNGIFDHTIELLAYGRELERKIHLFRTEGVLVNIAKRPEMKFYLRKPFGEDLVPTVPIEKNSLKDTLDQGVCDFIAHAGFSPNLSVVELLSDILRNYYEDFASKLKAVVEKEVAGVSHGFLDPMDRLTTELGLCGVRGLGDFYERRVIGYHKTVERNVEKLENKLGTLISYKSLEFSVRARMPGCTAAERKRVVERFKARLRGPPRLIPNLQIDSVPSI